MNGEKVSQNLGVDGVLEEQGEMVKVLVEDYKKAVTDVNGLGFNGNALDAEIDCTGRNKEFLLLDNELVFNKLVEERGACKSGKIFKVDFFLKRLHLYWRLLKGQIKSTKKN